MTFPANLKLLPHEHPDATIAVVLQGGFGGRYDGVEWDCTPMTVVVEPAGSSHTNRFGPVTTTVLSLSLGPMVSPALGVMAQTPRHVRDSYAARIAGRASAELRKPDDLTPMAVEAAALELATHVARTPADSGAPGWLRAAHDLVHERYADPLRLADIASAVGVEPDRLARAFRRAYHAPLASYVRGLRVQAAAHRLASDPSASLAAIAADAGFADQSHFTRHFARSMGTTPGRYRAALQRD